MNDYLSIHEFSKIADIEASKLRYWDEIGLFSPIMRDPDNNYRYYSVAQLFALNFVTVMSELQIPLKTIAKLREERDPEQLLALLEKQEKRMDKEMRDLRQRYSIVHARRELINYGLKADANAVDVMYRDETEMVLWPKNAYGDGENFLTPLAAHIAQMKQYNISLSFPVGAYHNNMDSFVNKTGQPEHFFTIDPTGVHMRKEGEYLVGFARGPYGEVGDLPQRMSACIRERSLTVHGPVYITYLHDEICTNDSNLFLAQACIAVK